MWFVDITDGLLKNEQIIEYIIICNKLVSLKSRLPRFSGNVIDIDRPMFIFSAVELDLSCFISSI